MSDRLLKLETEKSETTKLGEKYAAALGQIQRMIVGEPLKQDDANYYLQQMVDTSGQLAKEGLYVALEPERGGDIIGLEYVNEMVGFGDYTFGSTIGLTVQKIDSIPTGRELYVSRPKIYLRKVGDSESSPGEAVPGVIELRSINNAPLRRE